MEPEDAADVDAADAPAMGVDVISKAAGLSQFTAHSSLEVSRFVLIVGLRCEIVLGFVRSENLELGFRTDTDMCFYIVSRKPKAFLLKLLNCSIFMIRKC